MRHHLELIYPSNDTITGGNRLLALGIIPVDGDIVDVLVRRETAPGFGGDIDYDIRTGANSSSLASVFVDPDHRPVVPFGTLVGGADLAAFPIAVTALQSIGFYRITNNVGGSGARPTVVVIIEDGDPAVLGTGVTVVNHLARFTNALANEIEDAGVLVSIDTTLGSNSDAKIPTEKAVKTYADALFAANDAMVYKGAIDASANPNYPAADAGHTYRISVAGKIGGGAGADVEAGDFITCLVDGSAAGTQAAVGANWNITQANLDGAVIGAAASVSGNFPTFSGVSGKLLADSGVAPSTDGTLAGNSDALIPTEKAVKTYADTTFALKTLPQGSHSADYTAVLGDANTEIFHPVADNNPRTFTIPANSAVAYPVGTILTFVNRINTLSIAITTDTMYLAGSATVGTRTLGVNGVATALKTEATVWIISGAGLT